MTTDDATTGIAGTGGVGASVAPAGPVQAWCDRCGEPAGTGSHAGCRAARALEPPRYCPQCRRRMKVQVLPVGWSAACVAHGELRG